MQHLLDRHGHHLGTQRPQQVAELFGAGRVGAPTDAHPDGVAVFQHVAAVEGAGLGDAGQAVAQRPHGHLGARQFEPSLGGTGSADHRQIAVDHHGVFDEHAVGALVGRGCLDGLPAVVVQRAPVVGPLLDGSGHVNRLSLEVGEQAFGQPCRGAPNQGTLLKHAPSVSGRDRSWRQPHTADAGASTIGSCASGCG